MKHVEEPPARMPPSAAGGDGDLVWSPPAFVAERARRAKRRAAGQAQLCLPIAAAALAVSVFAQGLDPTLQAGVGLLAVMFLLGFVWGSGRARTMGEVHFAVRRDAVVLPASFASAPGLSSMGPPVTLKLSRIKRYEDMRKPEGRAVIVWSGTGQGGVVSSAVGAVDLTPEETETILDTFVAGLREVGVPEGKADGDEASAEDA